MRRYFFEILAMVLIGGSLLFFYECIAFLTRRDYIGAIILMFIGFAVIRVGAEMARVALVQKE
ncbi:MAG TPA: hypothetical protein VGQ83_05125 [Polyangia bacterium]